MGVIALVLKKDYGNSLYSKKKIIFFYVYKLLKIIFGKIVSVLTSKMKS